MMVGTGKLALLTLATAILFISSSASGLSPGEGEKQSLECNQLPASLANRLLGLMDWTSYMVSCLFGFDLEQYPMVR